MTFPDNKVYEFTVGGANVVVPLTTPPLNCQLRPVIIIFLRPQDYTSAIPYLLASYSMTYGSYSFTVLPPAAAPNNGRRHIYIMARY